MRLFLLLPALGLGALIGAPAGDEPLEFALKPAVLEDPARVPMILEVALSAGVPAEAWVASQRGLVQLLRDAGLTEEKGSLVIPRGDSRPLKLKKSKPKVVEFTELEQTVSVLFYTKQERWFAAPAGMMVGKSKVGLLELLDADLDGRFDESLDFWAWKGAAFRILEREPLLAGETGLYQFEWVEAKRGPAARLSLEALPEGAGAGEISCWKTVNRLRNDSALGPVRLSVARNQAAKQHAAYLQLNGPSGSGSINVHDEDPSLPGYTKEGHRAAGGNVGWSSGGRDLGVQPAYEFATLFHRGEFLCPSPDMGAGAVGGYSVVWVEEQQNDYAAWLSRHRQGSHWVMVPGPGQQAVPTTALRDSPIPASEPNFYSRSRSWPVSVCTSYSYRDFESASLKVFDSRGEEVDGFLFTLADAGFASTGFPADWIWAGKSQFESNAEYRAEFRAVLKAGAGSQRGATTLAYDWSFSTGR